MGRKVEFTVTLTFVDRGFLDREVVENAVRSALDNEFNGDCEYGIAELADLDVTPGRPQ